MTDHPAFPRDTIEEAIDRQLARTRRLAEWVLDTDARLEQRSRLTLTRQVRMLSRVLERRAILRRASLRGEV
jgi:hypothetical protein